MSQSRFRNKKRTKTYRLIWARVNILRGKIIEKNGLDADEV
jgi:hypothetical protein